MKALPLYFLLSLLTIALFASCGGEDDDDGMMEPQLNARIIGSYDGRLFERIDGNFGASYNGPAIATVSAVDGNTITVAMGAGSFGRFEADLSDETNFTATGITFANEANKNVTGMLTTGSTPGEDELSFEVSDDISGSRFLVTFRGTRR